MFNYYLLWNRESKCLSTGCQSLFMTNLIRCLTDSRGNLSQNTLTLTPSSNSKAIDRDIKVPGNANKYSRLATLIPGHIRYYQPETITEFPLWPGFPFRGMRYFRAICSTDVWRFISIDQESEVYMAKRRMHEFRQKRPFLAIHSAYKFLSRLSLKKTSRFIFNTVDFL